jgi:hypothetical protein
MQSMRIRLLSGLALVLGALAGAAPLDAQPVCPVGYYYASDGRCYPGAAPVYPAPAYVVAPPVYQPPAIIDGFALGIGLSALIGGFDHDHEGERHDRGHDDARRRAPDVHR